MADMFTPAGQLAPDAMALEGAYRWRVDSCRDLLDVFEAELDRVEVELRTRLAGHAGYRAIQAINGVGPVNAAIFVAEIGDVTRFADPEHLCSWAGVTPTLHESDTTSHRGHISKQGSVLVRWAAIEAVARYHGGPPIAPAFERIQKRRGTMIARVAAARKLLRLVFYGLPRRRDPLPRPEGGRPRPVRTQPGRELGERRGPPGHRARPTN